MDSAAYLKLHVRSEDAYATVEAEWHAHLKELRAATRTARASPSQFRAALQDMEAFMQDGLQRAATGIQTSVQEHWAAAVAQGRGKADYTATLAAQARDIDARFAQRMAALHDAQARMEDALAASQAAVDADGTAAQLEAIRAGAEAEMLAWIDGASESMEAFLRLVRRNRVPAPDLAAVWTECLAAVPGGEGLREALAAARQAQHRHGLTRAEEEHAAVPVTLSPARYRERVREHAMLQPWAAAQLQRVKAELAEARAAVETLTSRSWGCLQTRVAHRRRLAELRSVLLVAQAHARQSAVFSEQLRVMLGELRDLARQGAEAIESFGDAAMAADATLAELTSQIGTVVRSLESGLQIADSLLDSAAALR